MTNQTGRIGEEYTARWLEDHGYQISAKNYHSRYGEIDIIAENAEYIIFVEVKTRRESAMVSALEAVTPHKQKKIVLTAQSYLLKRQSALQPRFDVAAVTTLYGEPIDFQYFPNAFGG